MPLFLAWRLSRARSFSECGIKATLKPGSEAGPEPHNSAQNWAISNSKSEDEMRMHPEIPVNFEVKKHQ
jgi:hypothetical protein